MATTNSTTPSVTVPNATFVSINTATPPSKMDYARPASTRRNQDPNSEHFSVNSVRTKVFSVYHSNLSKKVFLFMSSACLSMVSGSYKMDNYNSNKIHCLVLPLTMNCVLFAIIQYTLTGVRSVGPRRTLCVHF